MRKRTRALALLVAALLLSSCSKTPVLERVTWNDDVYTNEFSGVSYTLPEGWVSASEDEIKSIMEAGAEAAGISDTEMNLANIKVVYDALTQNPETGSNVIFAFENLKLSIGGKGMSGEDYIEALKKQLSSVGDLTY